MASKVKTSACDGDG